MEDKKSKRLLPESSKTCYPTMTKVIFFYILFVLPAHKTSVDATPGAVSAMLRCNLLVTYVDGLSPDFSSLPATSAVEK